MKHHVIYIPGLGDHTTYGQDIALKFWRIFGLRSHYMSLGWTNPEGFEAKLLRLLDKIDELTDKGNKVSLCGTSAGASAVIAAYAQRPNINGVVTIVGKINRPETIGHHLRAQNPDFYEAAVSIRTNLDQVSKRNSLENTLCIYTDADKTVLPADAVIDGSPQYKVPGWGHVSGIVFGLLWGAPTIAKFLLKE